ncbi:flagellar hook-length control protein FliK [Clostridium botulinum]|nr:flagellar hook-length control protein FliK [Clostridium botulinum]
MNLKINGFTKMESNLATKKSTNESSKSSSFNEVLNNISSNKNINENNNKNNNMISKLNKEDIENIKHKLEEKGFSKEDLESIKSLEDLKKLSNKLKDDGDLDGFLALVNSILQCLYSKENLNLSKELEKSLEKLQALLNNLSKDNGNKEKLLSEIKNILGKEFDKLNLLGENSLGENLLETFSNKLQNQMGKETNKENVSLLNDIKKEIENILKQESSDKLSIEPKITVDEIALTKKDTDASDLKENASKEDKILNGFLQEKEDAAGEKINKTVNFMSHLNNASDINEVSSNQALEKLVINKDTMNADIIKSIKYMELNNVKDLTVKIMPKELGEVLIKISMEGGIMKANIGATTKDAYNLLNSNMQLIEDKLNNSGIKVQELSLNIYNEDTTFFKQGNEERRNGNSSNSGNTDNKGSSLSIDEIPEENISSIDGNVNMLA